MYKGTTPTFIFTFPPNFDPSQASSIVLTFSSNKKDAILEKTKNDLVVDSSSVTAYLSQEETLSIPVGRVYCQINFVYDDGSRLPTNVQVITLDNNLHNRVIE